MQRNMAMARPLASSVTRASQTCVVRPPWTSVASHATPPSRTVPKKLDFSSTVVKPRAPSGRRRHGPVPARGVGQGDDGGRVEVAVGRRQLRADRQAARDTPAGHLQELDPDEPGQVPLAEGLPLLGRPRRPHVLRVAIGAAAGSAHGSAPLIPVSFRGRRRGRRGASPRPCSGSRPGARCRADSRSSTGGRSASPGP